MSFLPVLVLTASCQFAGDPAARDATDYVTKIQPLLQENSLLAERVLFQAAAIYNQAARPDEVARAWTTDIVPLAEHLHHQATFIEPPESWGTKHTELVAIWGDRAFAYRSISEGLKLADREQWDEGLRITSEVKVREDQWFDATNKEIAPLGLVIEPYP